MSDEESGPADLSFEDVRRSFYYGDHADMQFKYLARMTDAGAADAIAEVLAAVGETLDTGDLDRLREAVYRAQVAGYLPSEPVAPATEIPFTPLPGSLASLRLALISAGGVYRVDDDPMGPDGPSQQDSLVLITEFLRGTPTLSTIPVDTPNEQLTARHPGYDARSAQRDPSAVFPLDHLRDLAGQGRVQLADEHYGFTGATSQRRLEKQVAPRWAEHMAAREVDVVFLVAT
ncbi:MAG: glycine/sarcosine/betaine reductase selenoprotein B family protein [Nitriliruptor sp.]|uniref:glycine/sarcosine/betaine reductase selenoprotein B family protein n=1 Tax=Nitriliruptor sp. TaxID=2448056 RepID=UPI0034A01F1C